MTSVPVAKKSVRPATSSSRWQTLMTIQFEVGSELKNFHAFVATYVKSYLSTAPAERATLASIELLDNALQYGSISRPVRFELALQQLVVRVSVTNAATGSRTQMLKDHLDRVNKDPAAAYAEEFRRSMSGSTSRRSMLGLVRIRHEVGMRLDLEVNNGEVTIHASCNK